MMQLADVAATSRIVADTPSRNAKIDAIAQMLRRLAPAEIPIVVAWLSGETLQGRSGVGYTLLEASAPDAAAGEPTLSILDVDAALDAISDVAGTGSKARRTALLSALFARATPGAPRSHR